MSLRIYTITGIVALITAVVCAFIDYKISLGVILAAAFSMINMLMLSESMKKVMSSDTPAYGMMVVGNMVRFTLLFAMIYIAYKLPNLFSMIGVAIGLILFMVALVIDALRKKGGS